MKANERILRDCSDRVLAWAQRPGRRWSLGRRPECRFSLSMSWSSGAKGTFVNAFPIDFAAREARIRMNDVFDPVRLVCDWQRAAPSLTLSIEKGTTA